MSVYITAKYHFDDRAFLEITSRIAKAGATRLRVGVVGAEANREHSNGDLTMGEVALINEYGTDDGHVPPRSFIRSTFQKSAGAFGNFMAIALRRVVELRHGADTALAYVGERAVQAIQTTIDGYVGPRNADLTIEQKGFDHPLLETRELRNSINFEIVRESGVIGAGGVGEYEEFNIGVEEA